MGKERRQVCSNNTIFGKNYSMSASDLTINGKLTKAQLELLKVFAFEPSEQELLQLKEFFKQYLANKALDAVEEAIEEKEYTMEEVESWTAEHNRTPYRSYQDFLAKQSS